MAPKLTSKAQVLFCRFVSAALPSFTFLIRMYLASRSSQSVRGTFIFDITVLKFYRMAELILVENLASFNFHWLFYIF